jgi:hypothetical protein
MSFNMSKNQLENSQALPAKPSRAGQCAKYGAHIVLKDEKGATYKTSAVVLDSKHLATYAHNDHAGYQKGDIIEVRISVNI